MYGITLCANISNNFKIVLRKFFLSTNAHMQCRWKRCGTKKTKPFLLRQPFFAGQSGLFSGVGRIFCGYVLEIPLRKIEDLR